jgi:hypothetical protein
MEPNIWAVYPWGMPFATGLVAVDSGSVLVLITLVVAPIAAIAFARSGPAWSSIGKGPLAIEPGPIEEAPTAAEDEAELREELRQLVVAGNERRLRRGLPPLDVGDETDRQLADLIGSR